MSTREKREQRKTQKARFVAMYPGLSHDEIIEECLKELKHHFEVGPEVALISAEKGVQCVPFDESLQKKFPYFEGTYEVFDVPHTRSTSRSTSTLLRTSRGSDTSACKTVGHRTSIFKNNETARIGGCRPCACKIRHLTDFFRSLQEIKKKSTILQTKYSAFLVENTGIEPVTSCMPCKRSPS